MRKLILWLGLSLFTVFSPAHGQLTVFGAGVISKVGTNVYRGQFSPDGKEFWFFRRVTPKGENYRIFVSNLANGHWTDPVQMRFGSGEDSDLYPTPSPDGRFLVFTSYRPFPRDSSGHANANLWYVERKGDSWQDPVPMIGAANPANYESDPWFESDGTLHFLTTWPDWQRSEQRLVMAGSDFSVAKSAYDPLTDLQKTGLGKEKHIWKCMLEPQGNFVVCEVSDVDSSGRRGPSDLWVAKKDGGKWTRLRPLGYGINTKQAYENFVVFTPDGQRMLFVRDFEMILEVQADVLRRSP